MKYLKLFFVLIGRYFLFRSNILKYISWLIYGGFISRLINVTVLTRFLCDRPIYVSNGKYITIHSGHVKDHCRLEAILVDGNTPSVKIGKDFFLGSFSHIGISSSLVIGDNFLSGANCLITDHTHGYDIIEEANTHPLKRKIKTKGPVVIGDNVFLGDNVVILGNLSIGSNVTIGASTIVTKDIPSNSIAYGNPMRIIPKRKTIL